MILSKKHLFRKIIFFEGLAGSNVEKTTTSLESDLDILNEFARSLDGKGGFSEKIFSLFP